MALFPDFIYALTPRDQQVTPLEIVIVNDTAVSSASTAVTSTGYTVPLGKILVISSAVATCTPGAAQTVIREIIRCTNQSGGNTVFWANTLNAAVAATAVADGIFVPGLMIPEGYTVQASATFNAGAAANSVRLDLTGILIPRGNFAI